MINKKDYGGTKIFKNKAIKDNQYDELELKKIEKLNKFQENILKTNDLILKEKITKLKRKNDFKEEKKYI